MKPISTGQPISPSKWEKATSAEKGQSGGGVRPIYEKNNSVNNNKEGTKKLEISSYRRKDFASEAKNQGNNPQETFVYQNIRAGDNGKGTGGVPQLKAEASKNRPPPPNYPPPPTTTSARTGSPPPLPSSVGVPPAPTDSPPPLSKSIQTAQTNIQNLMKLMESDRKKNKETLTTIIYTLIPFDKFAGDRKGDHIETLGQKKVSLGIYIENFVNDLFAQNNFNKETVIKSGNSIVEEFDEACEILLKHGENSDELAKMRRSLMNFLNENIIAYSREW